MRDKEIKDSRYRNLPLFRFDIFEGNLSLVDITCIELIEYTLEDTVLAVNKGKGRIELFTGPLILDQCVPLAFTLFPLWLPETHTAMYDPRLVGLGIPHSKLPLRVVCISILLHVTGP